MTTLSVLACLTMSSNIHAEDQATRLITKAKAEAARRAASGSVDLSPPKLTKFSLGGVVDSAQPEAAAWVDLTAKDDQSGVQNVILTLRSPSGAQAVVRDDILNSGLRVFSGHFAVGAEAFSFPGLFFSRFSEAGTWTADSLLLVDLAGNLSFYTSSDLAALGPNTVTVVNTGPWDSIPPILIEGKVGPQKLSLSKPPKGTRPDLGIAPVLHGSVHAFDPGNGVSSGMFYVAVELCLPDGHGGCTDGFEIQGNADGPGLADATVRVSGSPRADQMPGKYIVDMVTLTDLAGNTQNIWNGLDAAFAGGMTVDIEP